ncbi:unnamed protein product [Amoebophrya sp. A120]|nr:unnamed protein product [Amoebophrya sp. A120]|eukprot:GSA120T00024553001.1
MGLQKVVDMITFPAPSSSYSLTSHLDELFFINDPLQELLPIPCMYIGCPTKNAMFVLVHTHSNGCDMGDMVAAMRGLSTQLYVDSVLIEYPGYGLHEGRASHQSIDRTVAVVHEYLINTLKIEPSRIIWYGRSIGTGSACALALRTQELYGPESLGGLIIQCGFTHFKDVVKFLFGRVAKSLVRHNWNNLETVKKLVSCPILILHGKRDTMIPHTQAEELWKVVPWKEISELYLCNCGHNDYNFAKCTVEPMRNFFTRIVATKGIVAPIRKMPIQATLKPCVIHIGLLRNRIPFHSLRRLQVADLEKRLKENASTNVFGEDENFAENSSRSGDEAAAGGRDDAGAAAQHGSNNRGSTSSSVVNGNGPAGAPGARDSGGAAIGSNVAGGSSSSTSRNKNDRGVEEETASGNAQSNHTKVSNQNSSPTAAEKKYKYTPNDRKKSAGDDSLEMHNNIISKSKEPGGAGSNVGGGSSSSSKNPSPADSGPTISTGSYDENGIRGGNRRRGKFGCIPENCGGRGSGDTELVCNVCLDAKCPYLADPKQLPNLLNRPYPHEFRAGMFRSARQLMHFLTKRAVKFFQALREKLEQLETPETLQICDLIEVVQAEYWLRCPFPILYEEILMLKTGQKSALSVMAFGPFRIVEHPPTQDVMPKASNYEAFSEEEYDGKRVLENAVDINTYKQFLRQQCLPGLLARSSCDDEMQLDRNFGTSRSVPLNNSSRSSDYNRTRNTRTTTASPPIPGPSLVGQVEPENSDLPTSTPFPRLDAPGGAAAVSSTSFTGDQRQRSSSLRIGTTVEASASTAQTRQQLDDEVDAIIDVMRIPIWGFTPSAAQFRYICEWCLLTSRKLADKLPLTVQDLLKGKSGKSKAAKKIGESKLHEIEIANSGSNGSAVIVATGANKGYHVRRKSVSVFDEQKGGSSSSSANEKKKPPHKQGAGNSKQPPSILDLSAAFSSHYIQLMKNKVPQRATDVFLGGTELVNDFFVTRASALVQSGSGGRTASEIREMDEMLGNMNYSTEQDDEEAFIQAQMALFQEMDLMEQKTRETDVKLDDVPKQVTLPHPGTSGTMTGDESSDPTVRSFLSPKTSPNDRTESRESRSVKIVEAVISSSPKSNIANSTGGTMLQEYQARLAESRKSNFKTTAGSSGGSRTNATLQNITYPEGESKNTVDLDKVIESSAEQGEDFSSEMLTSTALPAAPKKSRGKLEVRVSSSQAAGADRAGGSRAAPRNSLYTATDHFSTLRHNFMQYGSSPSRIREVIFETNESISDVLKLWSDSVPLFIPDATSILESVEMACDSSVFVGDFFAAVLLKHYLEISNLPLGMTQRDAKAMAIRKYLHFNFQNLFKPEIAGGPRGRQQQSQIRPSGGDY